MNKILSAINKYQWWFIITLVVIILTTSIPSAIAQYNLDEIAPKVYQTLPNLPLENKYINKETKQIDPNNTLARRIIRYHLFVKNRPPIYRLDWKLTIADYLGVNEPISEGVYPGYSNLNINPMSSDRLAIQQLTPPQRDALVNTLVQIFNPKANQTPPVINNQPTPKPTSSPAPIRLPRSGDANLLK